MALGKHPAGHGDLEPGRPRTAAVTQGAEQPLPRQGAIALPKWRNRDGTVFCLAPAGEFLMGGTKYPDERPVHEVRFQSPFLIASTPVTNRQFRRFVDATSYRGNHRNFLLQFRDESLPHNWSAPNCPATFVSWRDAKEYALWCCERDAIDYRLPTEAQWEYACRAGERTVYSWGNHYDDDALNAAGRHDHPTSVGTYPSNAWGLFDMLGNVWEWCEDVKDVDSKEESLFYRACAELEEGACVAPVNTGQDALLSQRASTGQRVVRGGSFHSEGRNSRPANRRGQFWRDCTRAIGFRLIVSDESTAELV